MLALIVACTLWYFCWMKQLVFKIIDFNGSQWLIDWLIDWLNWYLYIWISFALLFLLLFCVFFCFMVTCVGYFFCNKFADTKIFSKIWFYWSDQNNARQQKTDQLLCGNLKWFVESFFCHKNIFFLLKKTIL